MFKVSTDKNIVKKLYVSPLVFLISAMIITTFFDYQISIFFTKGMDVYFLRQLVIFLTLVVTLLLLFPLQL